LGVDAGVHVQNGLTGRSGVSADTNAHATKVSQFKQGLMRQIILAKRWVLSGWVGGALANLP